MPKNKPPITDTFYDRIADPATFPAWVDFTVGQSSYFGMRIENQPSEATSDLDINNPTTADRFWIGKHVFLLGETGDLAANFPLGMLPDTDFNGSTAFVQRFPEVSVAPGASRTILHYVRSTYGNSNYKLPYGVAVEAWSCTSFPAFWMSEI